MTQGPGTPAAELDERAMADGAVTWTADGPGGRAWSIVWQPDRQTVRAWPFPAGRTAHHAAAADLAAARAEARRIAGLIAERRRSR